MLKGKDRRAKKAVCRTVPVKAEHMEYLEYHSQLSGISIADTVNEAVEHWLDVSYLISVGRLERALGLPSTLVMPA